MLMGLVLPDGLPDNFTSGRVYTVSTRFRDEVERVAMMAGFTALSSIHRSANTCENQRDQWCVSFSSSGNPSLHCHEEVKLIVKAADVPVWCVQVDAPEHLIFVRRVVDGKASRPLIMGNCYMSSLLQALFFLPSFRRAVYSMRTESERAISLQRSNSSIAGAGGVGVFGSPISSGLQRYDSLGNSLLNSPATAALSGTGAGVPGGSALPASHSIALSLQRVFYCLQTSNGSAVSTEQLTKSFGWQSADAFMQHDVQEFCRVLLDNLDDTMKKDAAADKEAEEAAAAAAAAAATATALAPQQGEPSATGPPAAAGDIAAGATTAVTAAAASGVARLFEGSTQMFIECLNVPYRSSRVEPFLDLALNVKGLSRLEQSFAQYVEAEELRGENQYRAEHHGKQDARKGLRFVRLPPVLQLQLKRFEFSAATESMEKVNDKFEFPTTIDLSQYVQHAEADDPAAPKKPADAASAATAPPTDEANGTTAIPAAAATSDPALYHLHSILVHSGSVNGGHYYSFVRPLLLGRPYPYSASRDWYKFDDETVTRVSASEAVDGSFGGRIMQRLWRVGELEETVRDSAASAYMLIYVRQSEIDNCFSIAHDNQKQQQQQLSMQPIQLPPTVESKPELPSASEGAMTDGEAPAAGDDNSSAITTTAPSRVPASFVAHAAIPAHLSSRFEAEERARREADEARRTAHLYTTIEVLCEPTSLLHAGTTMAIELMSCTDERATEAMKAAVSANAEALPASAPAAVAGTAAGTAVTAEVLAGTADASDAVDAADAGIELPAVPRPFAFALESYRVRRSDTLRSLPALVAARHGVPVERLEVWRLSNRNNSTHRPVAAVVSPGCAKLPVYGSDFSADTTFDTYAMQKRMHLFVRDVSQDGDAGNNLTLAESPSLPSLPITAVHKDGVSNEVRHERGLELPAAIAGATGTAPAAAAVGAAVAATTAANTAAASALSTNGGDGPAAPAPMLLLLKFFDVRTQQLRYLGSSYFSAHATIADVKRWAHSRLRERGLIVDTDALLHTPPPSSPLTGSDAPMSAAAKAVAAVASATAVTAERAAHAAEAQLEATSDTASSPLPQPKPQPQSLLLAYEEEDLASKPMPTDALADERSLLTAGLRSGDLLVLQQAFSAAALDAMQARYHRVRTRILQRRWHAHEDPPLALDTHTATALYRALTPRFFRSAPAYLNFMRFRLVLECRRLPYTLAAAAAAANAAKGAVALPGAAAKSAALHAGANAGALVLELSNEYTYAELQRRLAAAMQALYVAAANVAGTTAAAAPELDTACVQVYRSAVRPQHDGLAPRAVTLDDVEQPLALLKPEIATGIAVPSSLAEQNVLDLPLWALLLRRFAEGRYALLRFSPARAAGGPAPLPPPPPNAWTLGSRACVYYAALDYNVARLARSYAVPVLMVDHTTNRVRKHVTFVQCTSTKQEIEVVTAANIAAKAANASGVQAATAASGTSNNLAGQCYLRTDSLGYLRVQAIQALAAENALADAATAVAAQSASGGGDAGDAAMTEYSGGNGSATKRKLVSLAAAASPTLPPANGGSTSSVAVANTDDLATQPDADADADVGPNAPTESPPPEARISEPDTPHSPHKRLRLSNGIATGDNSTTATGSPSVIAPLPQTYEARYDDHLLLLPLSASWYHWIDRQADADLKLDGRHAGRDRHLADHRRAQLGGGRSRSRHLRTRRRRQEGAHRHGGAGDALHRQTRGNRLHEGAGELCLRISRHPREHAAPVAERSPGPVAGRPDPAHRNPRHADAGQQPERLPLVLVGGGAGTHHQRHLVRRRYRGAPPAADFAGHSDLQKRTGAGLMAYLSFVFKARARPSKARCAHE